MAAEYRRAYSQCCIPVVKVETRRLRAGYGSRPVLRDISLKVHKRCITAIIGPSGCGKSTLLTALNRLVDLIPDAWVTGEVLVDGEEVLAADTDVTTLRRRIGMIFQKPNPFPLSIERNIGLALEHHGVRDPSTRGHIIEKALRAVGLWDEVKDRLQRPALQLSGGQQQRLCIARAIALDPEVLLMDEPCSALDPRATEHIEALVRALAHDFTVVVVTHNLQQARRLSHYTALLWRDDTAATIIETAPTELLFFDPQHEHTQAYIQGVVG
ncbi:MAG: phosphate ABC transporter ATP-binding protein [Candidatus Binatia bacterium]